MDANFHSILIHHSRKCKAGIVHTKMGRYSPLAIGTIIHFFCHIAKNILVTHITKTYITKAAMTYITKAAMTYISKAAMQKIQPQIWL